MKYIALKSDSSVSATSRFISEKILLFGKVSLRSSIYNMIDIFCFLNETVKEIHARYCILECHLYLNLLTLTVVCFFSFSFVKRNATFERVSLEK